MDCVTYNAFGALAFAYESHDTFLFFQKLGGERLVGEICWLKVKQMKGLENVSSEASLQEKM